MTTLTKAANLASKIFVNESRADAKKFFAIVDALAAIKFNGVPRGYTSVYGALGLAPDDAAFLQAVLEDNQEGVSMEAVEAPVTASGTTKSKKEICFDAFRKVPMNDSAKRKMVIALLVETYGFKKTVVQSYATMYKNDDI